MRARALLCLLAAPLYAGRALAESSYLSHGEDEGFRCAGLFGSPGKHAGPRSVIEITIPPVPPSSIALAAFNYPDGRWLGIPIRDGVKAPDKYADAPVAPISGGSLGAGSGGDIQRVAICTNEAIAIGLCSDADQGRPLVNDRRDDGQPRSFVSAIYSDYLMLNRSGTGYTRLERKTRGQGANSTGSPDDSWMNAARTTVLDTATLEWAADGTLTIRYYANTTGYYCVDAASTGDFTAQVQWTNAHGLLPAGEYPKLHIYLALTIAYVAIALAWAFMSWRVWSEILPVQNQLFALVCLLAVDMGLNFGFWKHYNSTGAPSMAYSVATLVIDAGRNSLSFFMLLVVSLGWGVVHPSLGKKMIRCILLAIVHFFAGCLYGAGLLFRNPHESRPLGLMYVIPLSLSLALFYVWILSAIIATTQLLTERQQTFKLAMYNRLWHLLVVCLALLFAFFVLNVMYTVAYTQLDMAASLWRWLWLWTDGWLNIEYFLALGTILYWWRPTLKNYRYGLEELAGTEDEAAERELAAAGNGSFDGPRMGEDLELEDIGAAATKRGHASFSGDDVQFVINNDGDDDDDDDEDEADATTQGNAGSHSDGSPSPQHPSANNSA
ncbi:hypothetical protein H4R18_005272 [Coemansia javaensis]|uniref:GOST seven transmembrane domain-containing protein n=1 Tax=Coemansia javaensis TaxID=2761396 RepID=A0A9W8H894_9FUNG|nr:hypothetical protein H4R18_005272 [Coemansia javaensis]